MAVIRKQDLGKGEDAFFQWDAAAKQLVRQGEQPTEVSPALPRSVMAMAVRFSLHVLETKAPGPGVEVRVAPWGAIKILEGPASDPHNLTPPDVIELDPDVWLRVATGITTWHQERDLGRITAVGERDDLTALLPLI
ncbi:inorganic pyrophosphatase [Bifidobacterium dolichotidis]|uniref:Inorganic pyrophosphatase n=1 Tax=Bifidobacterium dolichotidis TaxID=2306976 RepID=A0A430FR09_9BIFI|nr:sterol carrier family protein [Bifidobacterium dolichotidis]RSX55244.1 inorganic pyrophosphatase [Bifidobacterium dolichotidis]